MSSVAVIDYGMGNLHSVAKALEHTGRVDEIRVTHDAEQIRSADRVVLPGVGAIRDCMAEIRRLGLDEVIAEVVKSKPFLGVCVGMQALMDVSEENGGTECLGILPGRVSYFGDELVDEQNGARLKVPHMGWNRVHQEMAHPLWQGIEQDARFYFVHSYYVTPAQQSYLAGSTRHGVAIAAALAHENIFAVQFHPEKSQHDGLQLYANFLGWDGTV
ncbi:MAG: imidazole glycerol phosphate synthase subunit HisH [Gammaproteobacteria bacterium]|nr:imidazole glycerol phosphate synthase subunit HisH [Gammaproteobacteria bacterium]MCW8928251.1 imidazole glycerol phosphate synthase subunit HisH [Gammaproteobacteria bacterium]MCW8958277.1 imidazole glycerol phosphate synthase subunit HisH [Gammaproteobacteria bacterium]MCW8972916.1 imidazole glycerol phosphate synthase subunit HisH [Gammaproteobacteria bacterium]MCW8991715.1 imidazole glycerol phosphate synthase subunit HisH [Gammaproteobacteria bacterium]